MAGPAARHGQGCGRRPLSQRGGGQDPVRRAAAAGPDRRAAAGIGAAKQSASQGRQGRARARRIGLCISLGLDRGNRGISRPARCHPATKTRAIAAAAAAEARSDQSRLLARPELDHRGPALVPSCQPGHCDLSGALRLVCRTGAAADSFVRTTRPADRKRLSGTVRLPAKSENRPHRPSDLASLRLFRLHPPPRRRRHPSRGCARRRSRISTACRSVSRG